MTWVFAIVLVLALGAVAAVASGRALAMPESSDDRVDTRLPTGDLSGPDVRAARLPVALRGYRMEEVDALLDRLAEQIDKQRDAAPPTTAPEAG